MVEDVLAADVVICGAGMAGLTAALSAQQAGAAVLILEKAPSPGGSTVLSGGLIWTFAEFSEVQAQIPLGNAILQQIVFDTLDDGYAWLKAQGVDLQAEKRVLAFGRGRAMGPPQAVDALLSRFLAAGGRLMVETALSELISDGESIGGVRAIHVGKPIEVHAGAVVLATGGFQGNPELLTRYVVNPDNLYLRSNPWSTGDALIAAKRVGAAVGPGLENFYGHALLAPPVQFGPTEFAEVSQYQGRISVALNLLGHRFADESDGGLAEEVLNQRLARQPEGRGFYIVDDAMADMEALPDLRVTRVILERAKAHGAAMIVADSLEELCRGLSGHGVPAGVALRTLREYNAAITGDDHDHLSPPRRESRYPLSNPPFYAVGVKASITYTMGGLAADEHMRVLRRSESSSPLAQSTRNVRDYRASPVGGLFAAGCDAGNISHLHYMGGLSTALTTGRVAGREAAAFALERHRALDAV